MVIHESWIRIEHRAAKVVAKFPQGFMDRLLALWPAREGQQFAVGTDEAELAQSFDGLGTHAFHGIIATFSRYHFTVLVEPVGELLMEERDVFASQHGVSLFRNISK